tara:strand:+ start:947 stop:1603 length:657 start_codon:yes stop_codon:yes gene_type:complete
VTIHKEGRDILILLFVLLVTVNCLLYSLGTFSHLFMGIVALFSFLIFIFILQFFRNPLVNIITNENVVLSPADGKIVIIDKVIEDEYFMSERIQISIFMSPFNVHINRNPITGNVEYYKYHAGKYLLAWQPKSSKLNERNTIVINSNKNTKILIRQIAGTVARRIKCYLQNGDNVQQGEEFGFIKFGSRVDLFLPLNVSLDVKLGDKTYAGLTKIGEF